MKTFYSLVSLYAKSASNTSTVQMHGATRLLLALGPHWQVASCCQTLIDILQLYNQVCMQREHALSQKSNSPICFSERGDFLTTWFVSCKAQITRHNQGAGHCRNKCLWFIPGALEHGLKKKKHILMWWPVVIQTNTISMI